MCCSIQRLRLCQCLITKRLPGNEPLWSLVKTRSCWRLLFGWWLRWRGLLLCFLLQGVHVGKGLLQFFVVDLILFVRMYMCVCMCVCARASARVEGGAEGRERVCRKDYEGVCVLLGIPVRDVCVFVRVGEGIPRRTRE